MPVLHDGDRVVWDSLAIFEYVLEQFLDGGGWPSGAAGGFSIADCMFAPVVSRFNTYGIAVPRVCSDYMGRALANAAVVRWYEDAARESEVLTDEVGIDDLENAG